MPEDLKEKVAAVAKPIIESFDAILVDCSIKRILKTTVVEFLVDKMNGGITLEECTQINRKISEELEGLEIFNDGYSVEVSSPGLDRPLKTEHDFRRVSGRMVKFHLSEKIEGKCEHDGLIKEVTKNQVVIEAKSNMLTIPFDLINKAIQVV